MSEDARRPLCVDRRDGRDQRLRCTEAYAGAERLVRAEFTISLGRRLERVRLRRSEMLERLWHDFDNPIGGWSAPRADEPAGRNDRGQEDPVCARHDLPRVLRRELPRSVCIAEQVLVESG